jgi:hypothetical protein
LVSNTRADAAERILHILFSLISIKANLGGRGSVAHQDILIDRQADLPRKLVGEERGLIESSSPQTMLV